MASQRPVPVWLQRMEDHGKALQARWAAERAAACMAAKTYVPQPATVAQPVEPDPIETEPPTPQPVSPWCALFRATFSLLRWLRGGGQ